MEKLKKILPVCAILTLLCACAYAHRRVILAAIKGEPMPEPPAWHFWCRRQEKQE